jgi:hypothetical protein
MTPAPLACTLTADQMRCNAAELLPALQARSAQTVWHANGLQFAFDASSEHLSAIVRTIDRERSCCAFLTFDLSVPAEGRPITLAVHGPEGTREFLEQLGLTHPLSRPG